MEIKSLSKKDYGKIIDFAIRGMHLDWYIKNKTILRLYGRYFLYLELNKATQIFAAYEGDMSANWMLSVLEKVAFQNRTTRICRKHFLMYRQKV